MYLISYDISENSIRAKLARYLAKSGQRLHKSVFMVNIPKYQLNRFMQGIEKITGKQGDVLVFSLCNGCSKKARQLSLEKKNVFIA